MESLIERPTLSTWVLAARPQTLSTALVPVAVGSASAFSEGGFHALPAFVALFSAMWIQIGTNFANDLFDFQKGADTEERIGPVRATQSGLVTPGQMRAAVITAFAIAFFSGLYLVYIGGWVILAIGVLSILAGLAYTGGPYPLGYHGLGDLFVFIFFGLVAVTGTHYVQTLSFSPRALALSVPIGLLATAVLIVNNIRDIDTDAKAGKRTMAVRLGRQNTRIYFALTLLGAWICLPLFWALGITDVWILLPTVMTSKAAAIIKIVATHTDGPNLIAALVETARLGVFFGLLMALGIVCGQFV
jgi:1,4-dihydroxy-2-naphthoate octaprenyltransferase